MEFHQIEYFVAVVETGGFSRAAERCNVAQPSLSQQIIKLEHELGQQLFQRLRHSTIPTEAGKAFYPRAKAILSEIQQAKHALTDGFNAERGQLSIGIIPTLTPFILHGVVKRFKERFPEAQLTISEDVTENLQERLINAELDVCYLSSPVANRQIVTEDIFTEKLLIAVNKNHPCADMPSVKREVLNQYPFVTLHDRHCLSQQIRSFCYIQQINPPVIYQTFQLATVLEFVRAELGIALIPECAIFNYQQDEIVFNTIEDNGPERTIVAARYNGRFISRLDAYFSQSISMEWQTLSATAGSIHTPR